MFLHISRHLRLAESSETPFSMSAPPNRTNSRMDPSKQPQISDPICVYKPSPRKIATQNSPKSFSQRFRAWPLKKTRAICRKYTFLRLSNFRCAPRKVGLCEVESHVARGPENDQKHGCEGAREELRRGLKRIAEAKTLQK